MSLAGRVPPPHRITFGLPGFALCVCFAAVEARLRTAIRVKPGDELVARLCCLMAIRDKLLVAEADGGKVYDGAFVNCTSGHAAKLEDGQWQTA